MNLIENHYYIMNGYLFLTIVLVLVSIYDFRLQKIPNFLTYGTMLAGLLFHIIMAGASGFFFSSSGLGIGLGLLIIPHILGFMGAGDVKLAAAVGAILGPGNVFLSMLFTAVFGGIYAIVLLLIRHKYRRESLRRYFLTFNIFIRTKQLVSISNSKDTKSPKLCYGIVIAAGSITVMVLDITGYRLIG